MGFLTGKRVLILGVASKLSIASGIAEAMHREGAELAFTYQNDKLKDRVEKFADTQIVDSSGNTVQTLINFAVSYNEGSGGQVVVRNYTMDPSNYGATLKNTNTMTGNFRGMLGHNYSDITGQWFNSTILSAGVNNGNGEFYPWNSKPFAPQFQTDTTRLYRVG